jgi:peptide/nickel transport system ATP-binding protein
MGMKGGLAMSLLEVHDLKTHFFTQRGVVRAVDGVNLSLNEREALGVAGESGSGKSTLAFSIIRLVPPPGKIVGGKILFQGRDILELDEEAFRREIRWKNISMIFQGAMNSLNPMYTIGDQLAEIFVIHKNYDKKEALEEAKKLLEVVGIDPNRVRSYPHELSGGMKQRVMIAMALALRPKVLIADEPTTALDVVVQAQIMNLLKRIKLEYGTSVILITHDLSLIAEIADRVAIMYAGKVVEQGLSEQVYENPAHPYTKALLGSIPRLHGELKELTFIPGAPPDLSNPPSGCRFHPRCPYAFELCKSEEPPIVEIEGGHFVSCWLYAKR